MKLIIIEPKIDGFRGRLKKWKKLEMNVFALFLILT